MSKCLVFGIDCPHWAYDHCSTTKVNCSRQNIVANAPVGRKEFLEQVKQMMNDNCINCEHCQNGDKIEDYVICTLWGVDTKLNDYCSRFEDKVLEDV